MYFLSCEEIKTFIIIKQLEQAFELQAHLSCLRKLRGAELLCFGHNAIAQLCNIFFL